MNLRQRINDLSIGRLVNQSVLGQKFETLAQKFYSLIRNDVPVEKPPWYIMVGVGPVTYTNAPQGPEPVYSGWAMVPNPERFKMEGLPIDRLEAEVYEPNSETGIISSRFILLP